jgi:hypothetical protein
MPKEIQNPPKDERAVAPKVFPTAISLVVRVSNGKFFQRLTSENIPHASKQLNKTAVCIGKGDNNIRCSHTASLNVDEGQDEGSESESRETERSWVAKFAVSGRPVKTWLGLSSKSREARRATGIDVRQWISSIVIRRTLLGRPAVGSAIVASMIISC